MTAPPGTPHTFANPGDQPGVVFCTVTPDLYINYFRELANLLPGPSGLDPKEVRGDGPIGHGGRAPGVLAPTDRVERPRISDGRARRCYRRQHR